MEGGVSAGVGLWGSGTGVVSGWGIGSGACAGAGLGAFFFGFVFFLTVRLAFFFALFFALRLTGNQ